MYCAVDPDPGALAHTVDLYRLKYIAQYPLGNTRSLIATLEKSERFALKLGDSIRLSKVLSSQTYLLASNGEVDAAIVRRAAVAFDIDDQDVVWFIPVIFVVVFLIRAITASEVATACF